MLREFSPSCTINLTSKTYRVHQETKMEVIEADLRYSEERKVTGSLMS